MLHPVLCEIQAWYESSLREWSVSTRERWIIFLNSDLVLEDLDTSNRLHHDLQPFWVKKNELN